MASSNKPKAAAGGIITLIAALGVYLLTKPQGTSGGGPTSNEATSTPSNASAPVSDPALARESVKSSPAGPKATGRGGDLPFGSPDLPAKGKGHVRVVTWNIENLYDDVDDPSNRWPDELKSEKPKAHRDAAGAVIRRIDADVLALQEVESEAALRWFLDEQKLSSIYPHVASIDAGDGRGIEQAVISKFPLSNVKTWVDRTLEGVHPATFADGKANPDAGKPLRMARSPLAVDVTVPGTYAGGPTGTPYQFTLLVVHAKSGREYAFQREAEAARHEAIVEDLMRDKPARNVVVLGDFNARKRDLSVQVYVGEGWLDAFGDVNPGDPRFQTHVTNRIIDHVIVSPSMTPELVAAGRFVYAVPLPPREQPIGGPKPPGYVSDHLPVGVEVRPIDDR
jgi:endonuclease/exonuclease/phosphatase family metal-dependent hydrolase